MTRFTVVLLVFGLIGCGCGKIDLPATPTPTPTAAPTPVPTGTFTQYPICLGYKCFCPQCQ